MLVDTSDVGLFCRQPPFTSISRWLPQRGTSDVARNNVVVIAPAQPDGGPVADVGVWAKDKLRLIEEYIKISRWARRRYTDQTEATYIDLWCGPGLSRIHKTDDYLPGSPVAAHEAAVESGVPFTRLYISDIKSSNVDAAQKRLEARGANVFPIRKAADAAVTDVLASVNKYGLHFAVLDPFSLDLPFSVISALAGLQRIDLMMLLSTGDLNRNFRKDYIDAADSRLDRFAPGWRNKVDLTDGANDETLRQRVVEYWFSLIEGLKFETAPKMHAARNSKRVAMYWLVFATRSGTATDFWGKAMKYLRQPGLDFG